MLALHKSPVSLNFYVTATKCCIAAMGRTYPFGSGPDCAIELLMTPRNGVSPVAQLRLPQRQGRDGGGVGTQDARAQTDAGDEIVCGQALSL